MPKQLPTQPNLEHLRSQAKDLRKSLRQAQPGTTLSEAQRQLAHDYGFPSWMELVEHVQTANLESLGAAEISAAIERGIRDGQYGSRARRIIRPGKLRERWSLAAKLAALEAGAPDLVQDVHATIGELEAAPIVYVAFSPMAKDLPEAYSAHLTALLERGSDPNAFFFDPDFPGNPFPLLYGASGRARDPQATRLLLQAGANPNDNESLYHAAESRDHRCLTLLLENGARIDGNELLRMMDFEDPEGLKIMLPYVKNLADSGSLIHAMRRGRSQDILKILLDHGAKPTSIHPHGFNAQSMAYERGIDLPELIEGYEPTLSDRLVRACRLGHVQEARALGEELRASGPAPKRFWSEKRHLPIEGTAAWLPGSRAKAFADAGWAGAADSVDAFVAAGFTLTDRDDSQGTPLHAAAFFGSASTVAALLRHHPPLDVDNDMYNAIPLQWAMYSSQFNEGEFAECVRLIVESGSPPPVKCFGSDPVQALVLAKWPDLELEGE